MISHAMLRALREIDRARARFVGGRAMPATRRMFYAYLRHATVRTRRAMLRRGLLSRSKDDDGTVHISIPPYGMGVLAGAKIFDRTRRRAAE